LIDLSGVGFLSRIPWNLPNILTLVRFLLIPVATVLICFDIIVPALAVYLAACLTDLLDGYIARRRHLITEEGALLDPLADKLMAIFVIISFTITGVLPVYILIVLLVKELIMIGGGIFLYFKDIVTPANMFGKISAFTLNTAIAFTFLYKCVAPWHVYFLCFGLALMLASLGQYAYLNIKKLKTKGGNA
jgi:cardiolipin synthase